MYRFLRSVTGFVLAVVAGAVQAVPVNVDGRQWLQPLDFLSLSWDDISLVCDATTGACNGLLNGADVTGYTWASVDDLNGLFNFYLQASGQTMGPGPDEFVFWGMPEPNPLVAAFFADFDSRSFTDGGVVNGITRTLAPRVEETFGRDAYFAYVFEEHDFQGMFNSVLSTMESASTDVPSSIIGAWFYKIADGQPPGEVPVPSPLALVGLGLLILGYGRRGQKVPR